ncbi:MAG: hypothetical protein ACREJX_07630, partial [Polyangiaceae bacterium]
MAKVRDMRRPRFALVFSGLAVSCILSAFGCGGIDEPNLFGPAGGGTSDGGASDARSDARAGSDAGKDGGVGVIDSGTTPAGSVQCSSGDCSIAENQVCCFSVSSATGMCSSGAGCSGDSVAVPCDSAQDCTDEGKPGDVCCAQADQSGAVTSVACSTPTDCNAAQGMTNMCDPNAANPCPNGGTCSASTVSIP